MENQLGSSRRDLKSHGLSGGNRTTDFDRCVVEDVDGSRSGNIPGDVDDRNRGATGITKFNEPIVQDIVVDLQGMACRGFQNTSAIVRDRKAAYKPVTAFRSSARGGVGASIDDQRVFPGSIIVPSFTRVRKASPIVPEPVIVFELVSIADEPSPTIALLALSISATWPVPSITTLPEISSW